MNTTRASISLSFCLSSLRSCFAFMFFLHAPSFVSDSLGGNLDARLVCLQYFAKEDQLKALVRFKGGFLELLVNLKKRCI